MKLSKLKSRKITSKYWLIWVGLIVWCGYSALTSDSTNDPEPHWGEWILMLLLAVMLVTIAVMMFVKFWPSNWENDPDNTKVQVREGMKIFD